jgi:hypothetical protein
VQNALSLAHMWKQPLFALLPDLLPPYLSDVEVDLWELYYKQKKAQT